MFCAVPEHAFHFSGRLGAGMNKGMRQFADGFVQGFFRRMCLGKESAPAGPVSIASAVGINGELRKGGEADLPLHRGTDDRWTDTDGQLTQPDLDMIHGQAVVRCRGQAHAAADTVPMHPGEDEFGASPHGVDDIRETGEEGLPVFLRADGRELVERGAATENLAHAAQDDDPYVGVMPGSVDGPRQFLQKVCRQRVALGVMELDRTDALVMR